MRSLFPFIILSICLATTSCKQSQARKPISVKSGTTFMQESIVRNQALKNKEEAFIAELIKKDSLNTYISSNTGFWYCYTKKDTIEGVKPKFGDLVNFDYNLKTLQGNTIYSKNELTNQNYLIDKQELFFGMREGLKLLQAGESAKFLFPSQLAFGYYGDLKKIGPNVPIISEVTVNSISKK